MKNVAFTRCFWRTSRTCGVWMGCGPSSKLRATARVSVGTCETMSPKKLELWIAGDLVEQPEQGETEQRDRDGFSQRLLRGANRRFAMNVPRAFCRRENRSKTSRRR